MPKMKKQFGQCAICGSDGELSYEHVPPKAAFNRDAFYTVTLDQILSLSNFSSFDASTLKEKFSSRKYQGGIGFYTLCNRCNNHTGSWYAAAFSDWIKQSMAILLKANGKPTLIYPTNFYPLRVIKQIITMFFSLNKDTLRYSHPQLVQFVLNKAENYLEGIRIYCYYNFVGSPRYLGFIARGTFAGESTISSELSFPPMGFVMTIEHNKTPDERLTEITHFTKYNYDDNLDFYQRLNTLPTHIPFIPGDYRTRAEIDATMMKM